MKQGTKPSYFDGQIADNKTSLCSVGFTEVQHQTLGMHHGQCAVVAVEDCQIQKSKYNSNMEILLEDSTKVMTSPKQIGQCCEIFRM